MRSRKQFIRKISSIYTAYENNLMKKGRNNMKIKIEQQEKVITIRTPPLCTMNNDKSDKFDWLNDLDNNNTLVLYLYMYAYIRKKNLYNIYMYIYICIYIYNVYIYIYI